MPNDQTVRFHTLDVVTVTTGMLVGPGHVDGIYEVTGHVLGDRGVMTHQLPAASLAAKPALVEQHPWLADIEPPEGLEDADVREPWCAAIVAEHGEFLDVTPAVSPAWHSGCALQDLVEMVGPDRVIPVVVDRDSL